MTEQVGSPEAVSTEIQHDLRTGAGMIQSPKKCQMPKEDRGHKLRYVFKIHNTVQGNQAGRKERRGEGEISTETILSL